jgi:dTDP-4-dehydrorhamnose reductase
MRVLVLGTGLVGRYFVRDALARGWEVVVGYRSEQPGPEFYAPLPAGAHDDVVAIQADITKPAEMESLVEKARPEAIIHAAAVADVELCEKERVQAQSANVWGTRTICRIAAARKVPLLFMSTAYVFDGRKGHYKEGDPTNPQNFFALTKLEGERAVTATPGLDHLIVRSCTMYGSNPRKRNVATTLIAELSNRRSVQVAQDQWDSPGYAGNVIEGATALLEKGERGLFHVAGGERTSRYGLAKAVAEVFGYDSHLLRPVNLSELRLSARRPPDSSLQSTKAEKAVGFLGLEVRPGLRVFKEELAARSLSGSVAVR